MNTLFRLTKVYLFVLFFLNTLCLNRSYSQDTNSTTTNTNQIPGIAYNMDCTTAMNQWGQLKNEIARKCEGVGVKSCLQEAEKCNNDSFSPSDGGGVSSTLNALTPVLGAGLGLPLQPMVGGMVNGANNDFFKCMPSIKRDNYKSQLDEIKNDAQRYSDKATDRANKIDDDKSGIREKISDKKKEAMEAIKALQDTINEAPANQKKIKSEGMDSWDKALDDLDNLDEKIAQIKSDKSSNEKNLQDLYYNVFADPKSSCGSIYEQKFEEYSSKRSQNKDQVLQRMGTMDDLYQKEIYGAQYKKFDREQSLEFRKRLNKEYGYCLESKKHDYQVKYDNISKAILQQQRTIAQYERKRESALAKLKEIPNMISTAIQAEKDKSNNMRTNTQTKLEILQTDMKTIASDYDERSAKAITEQKTRELSLQMAQMKRATAQAAFQMTAFGDAAPLLNLMNTARATACAMCPNLKKTGGMCSNYEKASDPFLGGQ